MISFTQVKNRSIHLDTSNPINNKIQMKKIYIPIILFIGLGLSAISQEKSDKEIKGDKYAFRYDYTNAIDSYKHSKPLSTEGQRRLAESYHYTGQDIEAEIVYSKLITAQSGVLPEDYFNYAMILKMNGKYDEAHKAMDKFNSLKPEDLRAKSYMENISTFSSLTKDQGSYKVENLKINSAAKDFAPAYFLNKIVFASTRSLSKMIKRKDNWTGLPFLNLYVSEIDGTQLKDPENFNKSMNTKMHDGPASFSNNGTFMAFTTNNNDDKSKDKVVELQISFSTYKDDKWSDPQPFTFNNPEYSVGHPCLSNDGKTMYFTSDVPGGFGGSDIYKTTADEKNVWSKPENLGNKINTEGDEMFPFIVESNGTLLFSSNGHFGLGGQDIFMAFTSGKGFGKSVNPGTPINTLNDDFAAIGNGTTNKGYLSSNRTGGSGDDDIYTIDFLIGIDGQKQIQGFAKDRNLNVLGNVFISLLDESNKVLDTLTTSENGAFSFKVASNTNYLLTGKKNKFNDGNNVANTKGNEQIVKADVILLTKAEAIASEIKEGKDLAELLALNTIFFDYGKSDIRKDAEPDLDKIIEIMNAYPEMIVEFRSYTDCRSTKEFNQLLSERRAKASSDYVRQKISNPSRIYGKGYGEPKLASLCPCEGPVLSECLEGEHQKNRRTEFIIVKK